MERRTALPTFAAARSARGFLARTLAGLLATALSLLLFAAPALAAPDARPARSFLDLFGRSATPVVATSPHPSVVRVVANERQNVQSQGSGTLIDVRDDCGLVVTNWHVVRDATGDITVHFPDGFASQARVLKVDKDWDLAALVIWKPRAEPVPLATDIPRPGDSLTIAGYGSGSYRATTGRCTQYVAPGKNMPYEMVELSGEARQGDSGGPIFNQRGELAGVLFGAGGGTTSGSYSRRVRTFLASVAPDLAEPNSTRLARQELASTNTGGLNVTPPTSAPAPSTSLPTDALASQSTHLRAAPPLLPSMASHTHSSPLDSAAPTYSPPLANPGDSNLARATIGYASDYLANTSPTAYAPPPPTPGIDWKSLLGHTPVEQGKTALALVGILAVLLKVLRPGRVARAI